MALIVQKYGGSSVANVGRIRAVALRVAATVQAGHQVAVVVSAMGDTTDELLELAGQLNGTLEQARREIDLLLSTGEIVSCALLSLAMQHLDLPARALTGPQAGIHTDGNYGNAEIAAIDERQVLRDIEHGFIPIVAGFQGCAVGQPGEINTLGRGGSDTTAVALAAALHADWCEIYTDVDGVYTADPRIVHRADRIGRISYAEMLELAAHGASVLHPRAVRVGLQYNLPILVRSSFNNHPGTLVAHVQAAVAVPESSEPQRETLVRGVARLKYNPQDGVGSEEDRISLVGLGVGESQRVDVISRASLRRQGIEAIPVEGSPLRLTYLVEGQQSAEAMRLLHKVHCLDNAGYFADAARVAPQGEGIAQEGARPWIGLGSAF